MSKSDKILVHFQENASEEVTGSMVLIEMPLASKKILCECGGIQSSGSLLDNYKRNISPFPFKVKEIDYVFIGHCHFDHIGRLGLLVKRGYNNPIIVPEGSKELLKLMLMDSAKISVRDALDLSKRYGKNYEPVYTEADVYDIMNLVQEYPIGKKIKIDENIEFQYYNSSHIVRACQICFWLKNGSQIRKIGYTSDLGQLSVKPQYYVESFQPIESCNLLISEATYADFKRITNQKQREVDIEKIKSVVQDIIDYKARVLFPTFSLHMAQVVLTQLYNMFYLDENFTIPIYMASPLIKKISNIWEELVVSEEDKDKWKQVKAWSLIHFTDNYEEIEKVIDSKIPCIVIASAGMLNAGFSKPLAAKLLPNGNDILVFSGYSAEGSLASKIRSKKQKSVAIDGKQISCRCKVVTLTSYSSHIQGEDLIKYLSGDLSGKYGCSCNYDIIAIHHSNQKDKVNFCNVLKQELEKKNKSSRVVCTNKSTTIRL